MTHRPFLDRDPRRGRRRRVGAAAAALVLGMAAAPALAAEPAPTPAEGGGAGGMAPTMIILDASNSMSTPDGDASGASRMEAARAAATSLVDQAPDGAPLGLVVYGTQTSSESSQKPQGCQDVSVLAEPGAAARGELVSQIQGIEASGFTPIGRSLEVAAEHLPTEGPRSIVLVSDGLDSCAPPPVCEVAADLAEKGADLTLHAIGFRVDDEAREDLTCAAEATGGTYSDAADAGELTEVLVQHGTRGLEGYQVAGDPIAGGRLEQNPVDVEPGEYLDVLEEGAPAASEPGTQKYYRVDAAAGQRVHVTATMVPPSDDVFALGDAMGVRIDLTDATGSQCEDRHGTEGHSSKAGQPKIGFASTPALGDPESSCEVGPITIEVERYGELLADRELPVELKVAVEPAVDPQAELLPSINEPQWPEPIQVEDVQGRAPTNFARSFSTATSLEPGTYRGTIVPGETQYVTVPASYGQQVRWGLEILEDSGHEETLYPLNVTMYNSLRQPVEMVKHDYSYPNTRVSVPTHHGDAEFGATVAPIRATNRDSLDSDVQTAWLAGPQLLSISYDMHGKGSNNVEYVPVEFALAVDAIGPEEPGPQLVTAVDGDQRANDDARAKPNEGRGGNDQAVAEGAEGAEEGGSGPRWVLPTAVGGAAVAGVGGVSYLLLRRRP